MKNANKWPKKLLLLTDGGRHGGVIVRTLIGVSMMQKMKSSSYAAIATSETGLFARRVATQLSGTTMVSPIFPMAIRARRYARVAQRVFEKKGGKK
ncbi:hypothetical protein C4565_03705 [Candidatus Parcubacteria bacterium]|nr:MAG: hypothetical protein C4565_03705 [Candidatus Parcubacteria bacterium]